MIIAAIFCAIILYVAALTIIVKFIDNNAQVPADTQWWSIVPIINIFFAIAILTKKTKWHLPAAKTGSISNTILLRRLLPTHTDLEEICSLCEQWSEQAANDFVTNVLLHPEKNWRMFINDSNLPSAAELKKITQDIRQIKIDEIKSKLQKRIPKMLHDAKEAAMQGKSKLRVKNITSYTEASILRDLLNQYGYNYSTTMDEIRW